MTKQSRNARVRRRRVKDCKDPTKRDLEISSAADNLNEQARYDATPIYYQHKIHLRDGVCKLLSSRSWHPSLSANPPPSPQGACHALFRSSAGRCMLANRPDFPPGGPYVASPLSDLARKV